MAKLTFVVKNMRYSFGNSVLCKLRMACTFESISLASVTKFSHESVQDSPNIFYLLLLEHHLNKPDAVSCQILIASQSSDALDLGSSFLNITRLWRHKFRVMVILCQCFSVLQFIFFKYDEELVVAQTFAGIIKAEKLDHQTIRHINNRMVKYICKILNAFIPVRIRLLPCIRQI